MSELNINSTDGRAEGRPDPALRLRTGWASWLPRFSMAVLLFETVTGLAVCSASGLVLMGEAAPAARGYAGQSLGVATSRRTDWGGWRAIS